MKDRKKRGETLKKIIPYLKPYTGLIVLTIILAFFSVVFALYIPILTGDAVDCIKDCFENTPDADMTVFVGILLKMGIVILLSAVTQWVMSLCNNRIVYSVTMDIRRTAFRHIQELPMSYLDRNPAGDLVSRMIADVDQFADGLLIGFTQLFTGVITILGTLFFMFAQNYKIALVVVLVTPLSLFVASFIAKRTYNMFREQSAIRGEQTALINEMIRNRNVVQSFNREEAVTERFDGINERLSKCALRATFFSSLVNPSTRVVNNIVYAGVALTGGLSAINGSHTIGRLTCFLSYANQYTKPFNEISGVVTELQNALACADRIFSVTDADAQIPDADDAVDYIEEKKKIKNSGSVEFEKVSFSYIPEKPLIRNLNLKAGSGQKIAVVGPTGCGKTTLINLLMRFYDTDSGEIRIDGIPTVNMTRKSLRTSFGMVLQDTWLKKGTIRENIAVGKTDATDEEIIAAAKAAHAHSFIRRLSKGYDTVITEDGGSLSGGQKQLLCIARVMLALPDMLILDEATSSIDIRTEVKIRQAFDSMMEGRTSFVVAHRLSTIKNADVILVMKDGNVIEQGKHDELLKKKGFYADLYNSQWA